MTGIQPNIMGVVKGGEGIGLSTATHTHSLQKEAQAAENRNNGDTTRLWTHERSERQNQLQRIHRLKRRIGKIRIKRFMGNRNKRGCLKNNHLGTIDRTLGQAVNSA